MNGDTTNLTLKERYLNAIALIQSDPAHALDSLAELQSQTAALFSFRSSTEGLDDIHTSSLPFLLLEHHIAMAYMNLPTKGIEEIHVRQEHLRMACHLWNAFFRNLEALEELLSKEEIKQYHELIDLSEEQEDQDSKSKPPPPLSDRETKIARHRAKQQATAEQARLVSLQQRRSRLGISEADSMDGHDSESLERSLAMTQLQIAKGEALDEWSSVARELSMIEHLISARKSGQSPTPPAAKRDEKGLQVTHINKDMNGQLQFRREDVRSKVFRPGWNQPTMSLDELAEREVRDAMDRERKQKEAPVGPRRYDQLVKEGLEDDPDLVEASAQIDRNWDDFKDANPRGSGNKRGDVGDRNF